MSDLFSNLGEPLDGIIANAKEIAMRSKASLYVIGGPVRDRLLGRSFTDLDLTVAGDASSFARELATRLGARLKSHPRFLTFKLELADGVVVDVTTTRSERYSQPGALPEVKRDDVLQDLQRRDFTINAVAVELTTGEILDPLRGITDLEARLIRILHDQSFLDDPTRILRALRFCARFDFAMDRNTESQVVAALASGALASLSRERVWREIFLAFREPRVVQVLDAFNRFGVMKSFLSNSPRQTGVSVPHTPSRSELESLERSLSRWGAADREISFLSLMIANPDRDDLSGSGLSDRQLQQLASLRKSSTRLAAQLGEATSVREWLSLLDRVPDEMIALIEVVAPHFPDRFQQLRELRELQLPFSGDDLGLPPGPHIGRAMREVRIALALGEIAPGVAVAFARNLGLQYLEESRSGNQRTDSKKLS